MGYLGAVLNNSEFLPGMGLNQANLNEGGVALTGMVGPNTLAFQPKMGLGITWSAPGA